MDLKYFIEAQPTTDISNKHKREQSSSRALNLPNDTFQTSPENIAYAYAYVHTSFEVFTF